MTFVAQQDLAPPARPLSAEAVLRIWEAGAGSGAGPTRRALDLLAAGWPGDGWPGDSADLAQLPLGQRQRRLLELRAITLGSELSCQGACPACDERLEMAVSTEELLQGSATSHPLDSHPPDSDPLGSDPFDRETNPEGTFHHGDLELRFRLPTSADLLAAEAAADAAEAQLCVVSRCVLEAKREGEEISPENLSEDELAALGEHLSVLDPLAETIFALTCQACSHSWSQPLEIGEVFYEELGVLAQRLLQEVSWLARGYGWSEAEILRLTPARRRAYLEMLWA